MTGERVILTLLAQIALILALTRLTGWVFSRFRQPQVLGEMLGAVVLGPSLLGWIFPQFYGRLFPAETLPLLAILAQLGAIFFMFLIGLELDLSVLGGHDKSALAITLSSLLFPFVLGFLVAIAFFNGTVALFVATGLTATSFPLLGRILADRNLHSSRAGLLGISCSAQSTLLTWCMLAMVVLIARRSWQNAIAAAIYLLAMAILIRPLLARLALIHEQRGRLGHNMLGAILLLLLASSMVSQWIGLHAFFGALVLGALMPKEPKFVRHLSEKIQDWVLVFLLPIFLAYVGLNTDLASLNSPRWWGLAILLMAGGCAGKIGGTILAGRVRFANRGSQSELQEMPLRESAALGVLLNARGLMLLLILTVALQLHLIPATVFASLVLLALVTTAITLPLLNWISPAPAMIARQIAQTAKFSILIPISLPKSGAPLVQIADALIGPVRDTGKLLALHLRRAVEGEPFKPAGEIESESLTPLLAQARARWLAVKPITFVSNDIPADITQTASEHQVNLVLMGYHNPIFGKAMLGGTVHRVLTSCPAPVAVFVDRGLRNIDRILVPYLGSAHDTLALELAARIVRNTSALATVLHVVPPMSPSAARSAEAKRAVEKIFGTSDGGATVSFQVVEDSSPVGVVLHQARDYDLVIIGVAEEWGLESRLFGWRPEKIARDCPASLLIVRNFGKPQDLRTAVNLDQSAGAPAPRVAM